MKLKLTEKQTKNFMNGVDRIYQHCLTGAMKNKYSSEEIKDMIFEEFGNGAGCIAIGSKIAGLLR